MVNKKGQSVLEYVVILTTIMGVVLAFAAVALRGHVTNSLNHVGTQMENQVDRINYGAAPAGG